MPLFLQALLTESRNNKAHSARLAGFNRSTLERKLSQYHLVLQKQLVQTAEGVQ
jgi:DNA-binding protein Fis